MASSNYSTCLRVVLKWEGGYSDHPQDPGGRTMFGVTQAVYDAYRARNGLAKQTVRLIKETEFQSIYRKQYWDVIRGDDLPPGVDLAVFDYAVNSGPVRAAKAVQVLCGVIVDGQIGERTLDAIKVHNRRDLIAGLCDRRLAFLRSLGTWKTFGTGWTNRVSDIRAKASAMASKVAPADNGKIVDLPRDNEPASPKAAQPPKKETGGALDKIVAVGTGLSGIVTSILTGVQSPWGLAALALMLAAGCFLAWRFWPRNVMPELQ